MINEMEHMPQEAPAIRWALGCILVSYMERIRAMTGSTISVSRGILALETIICFVPVTWLFVAVVLATAHGPLLLRDGLLYCSVTLAGPVGLAVAWNTIVFKRAGASRATSALLCILAAWTFIGYSAQLLNSGAPISEWWRNFVLIALLPVLAVVHLTRIASATRASALLA
jgi:hypothetical protein